MFDWVLNTPINLTVTTGLDISKSLRKKKCKLLNVLKDSKVPEGPFDYTLTCILSIKP